MANQKVGKIKSHTIEVFDWMEDVLPVILANLNGFLVNKGIQPLKNDLHGGFFKDGKWLDSSKSDDYRNYWHAYMELWGEKLDNDNYQSVWFPDPDDDEEWEYAKTRLRAWANDRNNSLPTDPDWTDDLVDAVRKLVKEHFPADEEVVFRWSW